MHCCSHWIALWGLPCSIQYQGVLGRKGRKNWDAFFLFIPNDAGYTWCLLSVFQRMGRFAIVNGDCHGEVVCDWNLYGDPCRLMYHGGGTAKKLFTFQTIQYRGHDAGPILQVIPIESFKCQVLVIEDDASIVEQFKTVDLKVGVTVVIPCKEYRPNTFLSQHDDQCIISAQILKLF